MDLEYYYWIGFIAADGTFRKNKYEMKVSLAPKDRSHLELMKNFFGESNCWGINEYNGYPELIYHNKENIIIMMNKFDLKPNKTYNPPNTHILDDMNDNEFLSFLTGYIDGDGCIQNQYKRKDCRINFHIHESWMPILNKIKNRLEKFCNIDIPEAKLGNDGYARLSITNFLVIKFLKNKVIELKIPYLKRKWNKIDEFHINKNDFQKIYTPLVKKLKNELNYSFARIGEELNISSTAAYLYYNDRNGSK